MTHTKQKAAVRVAAILTMVLALLVTVSFTGCQLTSLLPTGAGSQNNTSSQLLGGGSPAQTTLVIPSYLHPLTGLETTENLVNARPVSICIGNTAYAFPQYGLSSADILVEIPVEGGISRLMMITNNYEYIEKIGSVRSTRPGLASIANSFDAIQLYAGTSDENESMLLPYDTMDYIMQNLPTIYYRVEENAAPHNLMTSGALIQSGINSFNYRTDLQESFSMPYCFASYGEIITPKDGSALAVQMSYSASHVVEFTYNVETEKYVRNQFGEPQIDGNNNAILSFENVFILYTNTVTHENAVGSTVDISVEEGGSGIWCSNGLMQNISWCFDEQGKMVFYDANGECLTVNRGTSYIGFMKSSMSNAVKIQ